jgi:hypothetical protein
MSNTLTNNFIKERRQRQQQQQQQQQQQRIKNNFSSGEYNLEPSI